ncbi:hypothetical protein QYF61_014216 [Mycteria americana]|uniref:Uncharacterized protein n=1 Tax=Mycteria americana TaxID=33587 RepID=A0AAN7N5T3_MYCAM|nr:hypothetical protein QYF61_014216 [Mycteria americana]
MIWNKVDLVHGGVQFVLKPMCIKPVLAMTSEIPFRAAAERGYCGTLVIFDSGSAGAARSACTGASRLLLGLGSMFEPKDHTLPFGRRQHHRLVATTWVGKQLHCMSQRAERLILVKILLNIFIIDLDDGMEDILMYVNDSEMGGGRRQSICGASIQRDLN